MARSAPRSATATAAAVAVAALLGMAEPAAAGDPVTVPPPLPGTEGSGDSSGDGLARALAGPMIVVSGGAAATAGVVWVRQRAERRQPRRPRPPRARRQEPAEPARSAPQAARAPLPPALTVTTRRTIAAPPARTYDAIARPSERRGWLPDDDLGDATPVPPQAVRFSMDGAGGRLSMRVHPKDDGRSTVVIRHAGLRTRTEAEVVRAHWRACLVELAAHVERPGA